MQQAKNTLQKSEGRIIEYKLENGETLKLSPKIVRDYLTNGQGTVSDQEVMMFISLCKYQKLNPFLKEAYLIKYGSSPATMVVGKEAFTKRAFRSEKHKGYEAGVMVVDERGSLISRTGTLVLDNEKLVGGYAKIYIDGQENPFEHTVSVGEYIGKKSSGEITQMWSTKPATMIRKVALVQALREVYPEDLTGLYTEEETEPIKDFPEIDNSNIPEAMYTENNNYNPVERENTVYITPENSDDPLA